MTFSICVREPYAVEGSDHVRFGVAVTTRLPAVGAMCPFANAHGAVATQSHVNTDLGRRGVEYLADGLAIEDALEALLNADDGRATRQLHGVSAAGTYAFSGAECEDWFGHEEHDGYTVAGNLLTGSDVLAETAAAYAERAVRDEVDGSAGRDAEADPLAARLVEALAAGHAAGGDRRTDLTVQSAAVRVATTEAVAVPEAPLFADLRVDATETPVADLRETVERAIAVQETVVDQAESDAREGD
jgi:uncharacterized Ntn-hydrolase superfamily protein